MTSVKKVQAIQEGKILHYAYNCLSKNEERESITIANYKCSNLLYAENIY